MLELEKFCLTVQQDLSDIAGQNYGALKREQFGFLDSVVDPINKSGFEQIRTDVGDGKNRNVIVRYMQPGDLAETSATPGDACAPGITVNEIRALVPVTRYRRSPVMSFTTEQLKTLCDAPSEYRAKVIMSRMNALLRAINRDLLALYLAGHGEFMDGTATYKTVNILNADAGGRVSADPDGVHFMLEEFRLMGAFDTMLVAGAGNLSRYADLLKLPCCNQWGEDLSRVNEMGQMKWFWDRDVDNIIGTPPADVNYMTAFQPGAVQLLEHMENVGDFAQAVDGYYAHTTIMDPFTNMLFDFELIYDPCDKVWNMFFFKKYDLWFLPDNQYKATDDRFGTNNTLLFKAGIS